MSALEELLPVKLERHCQLEGSQVTILMCKCKLTGYLVATGAGEGHECLRSGLLLAFFSRWLRGLGTIVVGMDFRVRRLRLES